MPYFDDETRSALLEAGILAIDEDGCEVFTGLTVAETRFMLEYELPATMLRDGESRLFEQLHKKFMAAREVALDGANKIVLLQLERHRLRPGRDG